MYILKHILQRSEWAEYYHSIVNIIKENNLPQGLTRIAPGAGIASPLHRPYKLPCLIGFTLQHIKKVGDLGRWHDQPIFMSCDRTSAKRLIYPTTNKFTERSLNVLNEHYHLHPPTPYFIYDNIEITQLLLSIVKRCMIGCHAFSFDGVAQNREENEVISFIKFVKTPVLIGGISVLRLNNSDVVPKYHVVFYIIPLKEAKLLVYSKKKGKTPKKEDIEDSVYTRLSYGKIFYSSRAERIFNGINHSIEPRRENIRAGTAGTDRINVVRATRHSTATNPFTDSFWNDFCRRQ